MKCVPNNNLYQSRFSSRGHYPLVRIYETLCATYVEGAPFDMLLGGTCTNVKKP